MLNSFLEEIHKLAQSDEKVYFKNFKIKFGFAMIPSGGSYVEDEELKEVLNRKTVIQITNTDDNCFWYALTVSINKDNKMMKDSRYPKRRDTFAKDLCRKCKLKWDEPVSFIHIPLIEEALKINVYVINLNCR